MIRRPRHRPSPRPLALAALAFGLAAAGPGAARAAGELDPEAAVDAMVGLAKPPAGYRPSHAKGICGTGTFEPTPEAAAISTAPHFRSPAPAIFRLSIAGGNPKGSDKAKSARGLALAIQPEGGGEHHFVVINAPVFTMNDPGKFLAFIAARVPDPATGKPDPAKVKAFSDANPETTRQGAFYAAAPVPASYANVRFHGVHTFYFTGPDGARQPARWTFEPVAGTASLTPEQVETGPDDFLEGELRSRLANGPVVWDVVLQRPAEGDPLLDATAAWPEDRPKVKVGRLVLASVDAPGEAGPCQPMMFDPLVLPEGIEASDDPILHARSAPYAVSLGRRTQ